MRELTHGSLFTGFGMFDYAAMLAGIKTRWQIEINGFCQKLLEVRYPDAKRYRDIKTVSGHELERVNIISAGFPCQPHSIAGKRKGSEDERNLWPDTLRIIRENKPEWFLGENVYGILNTDYGAFFEQEIITPLEDEGYSVQPYIIPASAVGAVHRRDRLWIVAHSNKIRCSNEQGKKQQTLQNKNRKSAAKKFTGNIEQCRVSKPNRTRPTSPDTPDNGLNRNDTSCNKEEKFISDIQQSGSRGSSWVEGCGSGIVTDSDSNAIKGKEREFFVQQEQRRHMQGLQGEISGSEFDTNPKNERLQGWGQEPNSKGQAGLYSRENGSWDKNWVEVAAELCRMDDDATGWLYQPRFIKQGFDGVGRSVFENKYRKQRLEGLGNGIVWKIAFIFFELIKQIENQ
jgi:DNA-cytosine methyltransferase